MYWIGETLFQTSIFPRLMSRERFHSLRSKIHSSDVIQHDPEDPLKKQIFHWQIVKGDSKTIIHLKRAW